MRRRSLLEWLVYTTGMLASAAMPVVMSRVLAPAVDTDRKTHLRPPGALTDDNAFVASCIGCGLCVEVCPHPSLPIWIVERSRGSVARHGISDSQGAIPF